MLGKFNRWQIKKMMANKLDFHTQRNKHRLVLFFACTVASRWCLNGWKGDWKLQSSSLHSSSELLSVWRLFNSAFEQNRHETINKYFYFSLSVALSSHCRSLPLIHCPAFWTVSVSCSFMLSARSHSLYLSIMLLFFNYSFVMSINITRNMILILEASSASLFCAHSCTFAADSSWTIRKYYPLK